MKHKKCSLFCYAGQKRNHAPRHANDKNAIKYIFHKNHKMSRSNVNVVLIERMIESQSIKQPNSQSVNKNNKKQRTPITRHLVIKFLLRLHVRSKFFISFVFIAAEKITMKLHSQTLFSLQYKQKMQHNQFSIRQTKLTTLYKCLGSLHESEFYAFCFSHSSNFLMYSGLISSR